MDVSGSDAPGVPVVVVAADALARWSPPAGWVRREGFELPNRPWDLGSRRWVCVGSVTGEDDAAAALGAAARGTGLAVSIELPASSRLRFLEDLDRLRPVAPASAGPTAPSPGGGPDHGLGELERSLLDLVSRGATVTTAADRLHVSVRTAHRALARARAALGAGTTASAAARWAALRAETDDP